MRVTGMPAMRAHRAGQPQQIRVRWKAPEATASPLPGYCPGEKSSLRRLSPSPERCEVWVYPLSMRACTARSWSVARGSSNWERTLEANFDS